MADDDLLTIAEIAPMIGVTEASARVYHERATRRRREQTPGAKDMPAPDDRFGRTPVWRRSTIDAWKRVRS